MYGELHYRADYPLPAPTYDWHGPVMHGSSPSKTLAPVVRTLGELLVDPAVRPGA